MLIGQNKTSSVESTAIIDQAVVHGREHIDIQSGKIQMLQADTTLCLLYTSQDLLFRLGIDPDSPAFFVFHACHLFYQTVNVFSFPP